MNPILPHRHNDVDSPKLSLQECIVNAPQAAVTPVSGSAGATYTGTEQALINSTKTQLNELIVKLQTLGLLN